MSCKQSKYFIFSIKIFYLCSLILLLVIFLSSLKTGMSWIEVLHVIEETTIMSYANLKSEWSSHYILCHKNKFSKTIANEDGSLNVNTSNVESFWSQIKRKFKVTNGTSVDLRESYVYECVFKQNCKADGLNIRISEMLYRCYYPLSE